MVRRVAVAALATVAAASSPLWMEKRDVGPALELPAGEARCVEPADVMRREHPVMLSSWRDAVVRGAQNTYLAFDGRSVPMSLTRGCYGCHARPARFCDRCHEWVGVRPGCDACHLRPLEHP